jgi:hypothetical protein
MTKLYDCHHTNTITIGLRKSRVDNLVTTLSHSHIVSMIDYTLLQVNLDAIRPLLSKNA